jgi:hypothetical protein
VNQNQLLAFANFEHLGAAIGTSALSSRPPILHGNGGGPFHFLFGATLHTISLHPGEPPSCLALRGRINYCLPTCQEKKPDSYKRGANINEK